jgi:hypothetical protein
LPILPPSVSCWSISFHFEELHHVTNPIDQFSFAVIDRSAPVARRHSPPHHLTVDNRLGAYLTLSSSTSSCSKDPRSSPAESTSTPPPPPLLTVPETKPPPHGRPAATVSCHPPLLARRVILSILELVPPELEHHIARATTGRRACTAHGDHREARSHRDNGVGRPRLN